MAVNQYGRMALEHWQRWRPKHLAAVAAEQGVDAYFTALGETVAQTIGDMTAQMAAEERLSAGAGSGAADHAVVAGRLASIHNDAEQAVLRELVLLPPEDDTDDGTGTGAGGDVVDGAGAFVDEVLRDLDLLVPEDGGDAEERFEDWKEETLVALAGGRITTADLTREQLDRLRAATDDPRLRKLAGIRDEDLRDQGLL